MTKRTVKKRRTQAERTEASDKAMFKAAIKLIAKVGPHDMTLTMIGKEAGFSGGLVSYRFGSKSNLLIAVAERIAELWFSRVLSKFDSRGEQLIHDSVDAYLDAVRKKSDLMLALFRLTNESYGTCPELLPVFRKFDQNAREGLARAAEQAIEDGQIKTAPDTNAIAAVLIGMLRGIAIQHFINSRAVDLDETAKVIKQAFSDMMNPR